MNYAAYRDYWDQHARHVGPERAVSKFGPAEYVAYHRPILELAAPKHYVKLIYDIGCGPGRIIPLVRELWPEARYVGVDVSPILIDGLRERYSDDQGIYALVASEPALPALRADLILMHSVATHIHPDHAKEWLELIHDHLADGGRASISIHTRCEEGWKGNIERVDYEPGCFEQMLKRAQLKIVATYDALQRYYICERA